MATVRCGRAVFSLVILLLAGCKPRDLGVPTSNSHADYVDSSWITAAKSCWPELEHDGYSAEGIVHNLADPIRFRSTFSSYASESDTQLKALVTKPLQDGPPPDLSVLTNSRTPILTRGQAASGTGPHDAVVAATQSVAPPDGLCAVHAGIPVGFK